MAIVEALSPTPEGRRRLGLRSPANGEPVGGITCATEEDVRAAIARARKAQKSWGRKPVKERAAIVSKAVDVLLRHLEDVIATIRDESGKTRVEALAIELIPSFDFINYWSGRAPKDLADEPRPLHGYMKPLKKLVVTYKPIGVVGVITPWNGPFVLALNSTVQALLAGNAVLVKPSEVTPHSSAWAVKILHEAGVPEDVVQVIHGDGETGAALVSGGVDKISFTGSVPTGKKIAVACANQLIPCTLELGGKDAMIVCADANLERAAAAAVFLSMFNTGQVCMGTERIYVVEEVYDEFIAKVKEKTERVRWGTGDAVDVGSIFWDKQLQIIEKQVKDAVKKGAKLLVGGSADRSRGVFFQPTLLTDLTHEMQIMQEETFGPVACVMKVKSESEAIERANDCKYGLSASVFTSDEEKAIRIAKQLEAGSVVHNDGEVIYGVPEAPFGGVKESGVGQVNGVDALRHWSRAQPILLDRWNLDKENVWYPFGEDTLKALEGTIKYVFGTPLRRLMR
ncbi:MAG: aldehyde dehydrogenase family protein [Polyangiaceae bacterium]|nr:aldehyde dehydrogenase family protein [Polyangiaceae bacterium]